MKSAGSVPRLSVLLLQPKEICNGGCGQVGHLCRATVVADAQKLNSAV